MDTVWKEQEGLCCSLGEKRLNSPEKQIEILGPVSLLEFSAGYAAPLLPHFSFPVVCGKTRLKHVGYRRYSVMTRCA